jgi:hypothetical protein
MSTSGNTLRKHPFPMVRSGGLFILLVGLGILAGAALGEHHLVLPLIVGASLAIIAQGVFRNRLVRPLGSPTRFQVTALIGAIILEMIITAVVAYEFHFRQSRSFWLWILLVVGGHFMIIAIAQGRLPFLLGVACVANAVVGLWLPQAPLVIFWSIDGVMKIIVGSLMLSTRPQMECSG